MSNFVDDSDNDDKASDEMGDIDYYRSEVGEEPEPGNVILLTRFITTTLIKISYQWYDITFQVLVFITSVVCPDY